jgi:DNA recombination protein RmuC
LDPLALIAIVVALLGGLALGWFLGSRGVVEARAERDKRESDFKAAISDLNRKDIELATLKAETNGLEARFAELAARALGEAQEAFLKRADDRFKQSETMAGENLKSLLQPVNDRLLRYEEGVAKVEAERRNAFGELKGQIEQMRIGTERVSTEAAKLVNSLRNAPKSRGRWGEQQLKNAFGAVDDSERHIGLAAHAASMKAHINALGNKAYWSQFEDAPDYVIMFVPGEHFLSAALEHDHTLWDFAFEKRVLLATPTNLIAIARTVAAVWRQEKLAKEARQIGELGKELYDRLAKALGDLRVVGSGLNTAVKNFNAFANSLETRALVSARKLKDLNIETGAREIETIPPVELLASHAGDPDLPEAQAAE